MEIDCKRIEATRMWSEEKVKTSENTNKIKRAGNLGMKLQAVRTLFIVDK